MLLVMIEFGFDVCDFQKEDFLIDNNGKRGFVSLVIFEEAYQNKIEVVMDNSPILDF